MIYVIFLYYILYNKVLTDKWRESKMTLGKIPNKIVGINKAINKLNSNLVISWTGFKWGEYSP